MGLKSKFQRNIRKRLTKDLDKYKDQSLQIVERQGKEVIREKLENGEFDEILKNAAKEVFKNEKSS